MSVSRLMGRVEAREEEMVAKRTAYTIRAMTAADAESVAHFTCLFEPVSAPLIQGFDAYDVAAWIRERLALPEWAGFVAEAEGEILGFVLCVDMAAQTCGFFLPMTKETAYLVHLAVDPAFQGRGIGRALIASCEERARHWGRSSLLLATQGRGSGLGLYRRLGFERLGSQVLLAKRL